MNRREFLKMGATQVAGAIVLTACGGILPDFANGMEKRNKIVVSDTNLITTREDLKIKKVINFEYQGKRSILVYNEGNMKAFENICTHRGGPTELKGGVFVCQWHGATFDPLTGKALSKPAPSNSQLPEIKLRIEGDKIFVAG